LVTIDQTVFGVRLTTVMRRLPAGAVEGWSGAGSAALAVGSGVFFFDAVALGEAEGEGEAEVLWLGEGDAPRETAGRAAVSWWAVVRVLPVPDGVHTP
jgi:hypothetical protein